MNTILKTKDILKIFNPLEDQICYKGENFLIDLQTIDNKVKKPGSYLFEITEDKKEEFYNKTANYILNYNKNNGISINFESENISTSINGFIHYISSLYLKQNDIFVHIEDNLTGQNFIKSKKLKEIKENFSIINDKEYLNDLLNIRDDKLLIDFFSWNPQETITQEEDFEFFINELKSNVNFEENFFKIYNQIPNEIKENTEFIKLLLTRDIILTKLVINDYFYSNFSKNGKFILDLNNEKVKDIIFSEPEESFLKIFKYINEHSNSCKDNELRILSYHNELYKDQRVINFFINLKDKHYCVNYSDIYINFDEETKSKKEIAIAYIYILKKNNHNLYFTDSEIFKIPLKTIQEPEILNELIQNLSFSTLEKKLKQNNIPVNKLKEDVFIHLASKFDSAIKLKDFFDLFYDKKELDIETAKKLLLANKSLIGSEVFSSHFSNMDFLIFLSDKNISTYHLDFNEIIKPHLFKENHNLKEKEFFIKYFLNKDLYISNLSFLGLNKEEIEFIKDNYLKPEYLFFKSMKDNDFYKEKDMKKHLNKIKTTEQLIQFIESIKETKKEFNIIHDINSKFIVRNIHENLKNNKEAITFLLNNFSKYVDIDSSNPFFYNKDCCLEVIKKHTHLINKIPEHMFYDKEIALTFAEHLDSSGDLNQAPIKIKKFFSQKKINHSYYSFLQSFISFNELQETINTKDEAGLSTSSKKTNRLKI